MQNPFHVESFSDTFRKYLELEHKLNALTPAIKSLQSQMDALRPSVEAEVRDKLDLYDSDTIPVSTDGCQDTHGSFGYIGLVKRSRKKVLSDEVLMELLEDFIGTKVLVGHEPDLVHNIAVSGVDYINLKRGFVEYTSLKRTTIRESFDSTSRYLPRFEAEKKTLAEKRDAPVEWVEEAGDP